MNSKYFILTRRNKTIGPYTLEELIEKEIKYNTQIWVQGSVPKTWCDAKSIDDLKPVLKQVEIKQTERGSSTPPLPPSKLISWDIVLLSLFYFLIAPALILLFSINPNDFVSLILEIPWVFITILLWGFAMYIAFLESQNLNRKPWVWMSLTFLSPPIVLLTLGLLRVKP